MSLEFVPLHSVCEIQGGFAFKSSDFVGKGIPVLRIGNIQDNTIVFDEKTVFLPEPKTAQFNDYLVGKGDLLIALSGATTGKYGVYLMDEPALLNQRVAKLTPINGRIDKNYLYYCLGLLTDRIRQQAMGAAQPNISPKEIGKISIPLPSLTEQERIALILNQAKLLINKRKEAISKVDELVQAVFLDMFGDPVLNNKGWSKTSLGNQLLEIENGWSPSCESYRARAGWGVLKLSAITKGEYLYEQNKALPSHVEPKKDKEVIEGDLLFVRKNTIDLVGTSAYVFDTPRNLMMPDTVFRFVLGENSGLNKIFLWQLLNQKGVKREIQKLAGGSAGSMPNISKKKLRDIEVILPNKELRKQFGNIVEKIYGQKKSMMLSLNCLEEYFYSLLERIFKGELFNTEKTS